MSTPRPATDDTAGSPTRLYVGLFFLVLLGELSAVGYILIATALPRIAAHFHTTQTAWTFTILNVVSGVLIGFAGKLADMHGKRLILILLVVGADIGCVISALAPSYGVFLVGRGLQGCLYLVPAIGFALVRDVLPKRLVAVGVSVVFTGSGLVFVFGPFLAAWLIDTFGPLSIFWFAFVLQTVCIVGLLVTIPESPVRKRGRLDWVAAILVGAGSALLVYGAGEGSTWGWLSSRFLGVMIGGILCFVVWMLWDRRFGDPLFPMRLLASKRVWTTLLIGSLGYGINGPLSAMIPGMLQTPRHHGFGFGLGLYGTAGYEAPLGIATAVAGILLGIQARRWGIRRPLMVGFAFFLIACGSLATLPGSPVAMMATLAVYGAGVGITNAAYPHLMMQATPPEEQGIAATLQNTGFSLGQALPTQVVFAFMTPYLFSSGGGYFYGGSGYRLGFEIIGGIAVAVAVLTIALLPHGRRRDVLGVRAGSEEVA